MCHADGGGRDLVRFDEAFGCELSDRFEQPVAGLSSARLCDDEALVDE